MTSEALDGLAVPPADPVGVIVDLLTAAEPGLDRTAAAPRLQSRCGRLRAAT
jgi:hypothetical protein